MTISKSKLFYPRYHIYRPNGDKFSSKPDRRFHLLTVSLSILQRGLENNKRYLLPDEMVYGEGNGENNDFSYRELGLGMKNKKHGQLPPVKEMFKWRTKTS